MPHPKLRPERRQTLCASLRSRNACQDFTRATLYGNLQGKCRGPAGSHKRDPHFARACAIEMHATFYKRHQKSHFRRKVTGKMPQPRLSPERGHTFCASVRTPALTLTVRTPQCGHAVWGQIISNI